VLTDFVPLSKTMAEQINALRSWSKGRARCANLADRPRTAGAQAGGVTTNESPPCGAGFL
jgi:hypothetical protein